jgi:hypothetical protein
MHFLLNSLLNLHTSQNMFSVNRHVNKALTLSECETESYTVPSLDAMQQLVQTALWQRALQKHRACSTVGHYATIQP